jgi:hypothetical protein
VCCCERCSRVFEPSEVPTKRDWCSKEGKIMRGEGRL